MVDLSNNPHKPYRIVKIFQDEGEPLISLRLHDKTIVIWTMGEWSHMISHITLEKPTGDDSGGKLLEAAELRKAI